ncbi:MAG: LEA type 2 family protein [Treponema sp.]|nr:LEA type 2 family protein [Treponema sp.]
MRKKLLVVLGICGTSFLLLYALISCQTLSSALQDPLVSLHSAEISSFTITEASVLALVRVENPNPFEIPFPEIGWQLFLNDNSFISGTIRNNQNIRARSATLIEVPVSLNYLDIVNTFSSLRGRTQLNYRVALRARFSLPLLRDREWPLEYSGLLPMPQLPRFGGPSMRIDRADLSGADIAVSVNIENPNSFPLPVPRFMMNYQVNGNSFLIGTMEGRGPVPAQGSMPITFGFPVRYIDLIQRFQNLGTLREASSLLTLTFDFGIPFFAQEPQVLQIPGTLPLR